MCYCPTPTLYLNLALTGDCAFQLSPKKPHSVWFISVLKSGDMGQCPEKSPSPCNTCVIPVSLYKSMSWFVTKTRAHTHTHTRLNAYTLRPSGLARAEASRGEATRGVWAVIWGLFEEYSCQAPNTSDLISQLDLWNFKPHKSHKVCVILCCCVSPYALQAM